MSTTPTDTCVHCAGPIEFVRTTWTVDGGTQRKMDGFVSDWMHVGGGRSCPPGTPGLVPSAAPPPRCPKCRSTRYTTAQEAWCDVSTCATCGHRDVRMIGD